MMVSIVVDPLMLRKVDVIHLATDPA